VTSVNSLIAGTAFDDPVKLFRSKRTKPKQLLHFGCNLVEITSGQEHVNSPIFDSLCKPTFFMETPGDLPARGIWRIFVQL
jgi:hypothetical protein